MAPRVSVIIPALNEAANLAEVLPRVPDEVEVVLVDGGSIDGTVEVAQRHRPDVRVLRQPRRGKGAALIHGLRHATGDVIVTLDADGSARPEEIPRFVSALVAGAEFAKGSRFLPGGGSADITRIRSLGNMMLTRLVNLLFGSRYSDLCYGFNAFWSHVVPILDLDADGFEIETQMNLRAVKARLAVVEVPSYEDARIYGVSNLRTMDDGLRVLGTILHERFRRRASTAWNPAARAPAVYEEPVEVTMTPQMLDA